MFRANLCPSSGAPETCWADFGDQ